MEWNVIKTIIMCNFGVVEFLNLEASCTQDSIKL